MERFERGALEPMPYANETLLVGEFRGSSRSQLLWTTTQTMHSWVAFRRLWGVPIYLPYAFKRIGEGGHAAQSQHYAGTAFDCAQNLTNARRALMRQLAERSGLWSYVEPVSISPTWVHMDRRLFPPACAAGYPQVRQGCLGVYVCVLQDALNVVSGAGLGIDGIFGPVTHSRVRLFQATRGLTADGVVGCYTWQALTAQAVGRG
jgi:peptidoglycan hydrolase-like protein with peptidoglycan-binding domain